MRTDDGVCSQAGSLQPRRLHVDDWPHAAFEFNVSALDALLRRGCNCTQVLAANGLNDSTADGTLQCAEFEFKHGWLAELLATAAFAVIVICALAGNATVLWIILAHRRMRTVTNYFLLNLALADASISLLNVIFSFTQNFYYRWFFGRPYCYVSNLMGVAPTVASSTTLMVMSWERYMVIVFPMRRRLSKHESLAAIASIWLLALGSAVPNCALTDYSTYVRLRTVAAGGPIGRTKAVDLVHYCNTDFGNRFAAVYSWYLLAVQYILPLFVLSYTYLFIVRALWFAPGIGAHKHADAMAAKKKVVKMLSVVVLVFMVCWLPYQLYFAVLVEFMSRLDPLLAQTSYLCIYWLAMSTTMWTPIVYCYLSSSFRVGFRYAWRWVPCVGVSKEEYAASDLFDRRYGARSSRPSNCHLSFERSKHSGVMPLDEDFMSEHPNNSCPSDSMLETRKLDCLGSTAAARARKKTAQSAKGYRHPQTADRKHTAAATASGRRPPPPGANAIPLSDQLARSIATGAGDGSLANRGGARRPAETAVDCGRIQPSRSQAQISPRRLLVVAADCDSEPTHMPL